MSSPEEIDDQQTEHDAQPGPQIKKRRVQTARACDRCRLKKIRCDGSPDPGAKCSHCAMSDSICVFTTGIKQKRAPAKKYVDGLETRLERLEALLSRLHPDSDFSHELDGDPPSSASQVHSPQGSISSSHRFEGSSKLPHALFDETHDIDTHDEQFVPSPEAVDSGGEEEELIADHVNVIRKLREMNITSPLNRYYGRSSSVRLYATAFNMKSEVSGQEQNILQEVLDNAEKRPDFWKLHPWERTRFSHQQKTSFIFPDPDLMVQLVHTYFSLVHFLMPILHRPTFEASFAEGAHFRDEGFGTIVLLVCAVGARFVDDSRVFLDDPEKPGHPHSAGWKWFNQVQLVGNAALSDPTLTDLQSIALSILFLSGSSPPQASWTLAGIGIRLAQDVGVHRRKTFAEKSFEGELWKRSFWALVGLDVTYSSFLGRPCAIALDSFDVDFPVDCDDEYWAPIDPSMTFKQPPGKPSSVAFMIFWIKLQLIHSHALRTIYSLEKHKVIAKIGEQEWEKRVVSELDSALNRWFDALPDHLRWDPSRPNEVHFFQTVALHASYHHVQMTIHRPFIPSTRKVSSLSFPSFTICANSARACIHVLQAHERRLPRVMIMNLLIPAFLSGIVLVLRVWVAKRSGMKIDAEKDLKDVRHAIQFISAGEIRWPLAGRFKDLLSTLVKVGEIPLPMASPTMKRSRDDGEKETASRSSAPASATFPPTSGLASTSRRSSTGLTEFAQPPTSSNSMSTFGPPVGPHEGNQPPLFGSTVPHNNSTLSSPFHPAYSGDTIRSQQSFNYSSILPAKPSNQASDRSAGVSNAAFQSQTPYQPIQDLYTLLNGPEQSPMMPFDTPTPPSSETSPAATLGLGTDLYGQYTGVPVSFGPDIGVSPQAGSSSSSRGPASMSAADNFLNFLAPMVPQDGQMDVSDDMVAMWSTLPTNFQSEDWENYMSNMMSLSGNAQASTGMQQQHSRQKSQPQPW